MATVLDIPSLRPFSQLPHDERLQLVMTCRANRLKTAPAPAARAKRAPAKRTAPTTLSEDQLLALITSNPALVAKLLGGS